MSKVEGWIEAKEDGEHPEVGYIAFVNMKIGENFAMTTWAEYLGNGQWKPMKDISTTSRKVRRVTHWARFDMEAHMKSIGLAE